MKKYKSLKDRLSKYEQLNGLTEFFKKAVQNKDRVTVFGYYFEDSERFGVVEFDEYAKVISVEEKLEN